MRALKSVLSKVALFAILLFLLAPVIMVFPISFSADAYVAWPPSAWSTRWYSALWKNEEMARAFRNSAIVALTVMFLTVLIATPAAIALYRGKFRGKHVLLTIFTTPLLLPSIVLGLAMLIVFVKYRLVGTFPGVMLAHLVLTVPYALRILITGLSTLPPFLEEAASSLGARPVVVFFRVTLPLMVPAIIASMALSFIVSFDEVVVSLFIAGAQLELLPVSLYHYVEVRTDPLVAAISALIVVATLVVVIVVERAMGLRRAMSSEATG